MEVLLLLIADIRMINPRLDHAFALLIKLSRDSVCILHGERDIQLRAVEKEASYFAREAVHDPGLVWVALEYVFGHFLHGGSTVRGLWEHLVV